VPLVAPPWDSAPKKIFEIFFSRSLGTFFLISDGAIRPPEGGAPPRLFFYGFKDHLLPKVMNPKSSPPWG